MTKRHGSNATYKTPRRGKKNKKIHAAPIIRRTVIKEYGEIADDTRIKRNPHHHNHGYNVHVHDDVYVPRRSYSRKNDAYKDGIHYVSQRSYYNQYDAYKDGDHYLPQRSHRHQYNAYKDEHPYIPQRSHLLKYDTHKDSDPYVPHHYGQLTRAYNTDAYNPRRASPRDYGLRAYDGDAYVPRRSALLGYGHVAHNNGLDLIRQPNPLNHVVHPTVNKRPIIAGFKSFMYKMF